jgi:hypothetical protein
MGRGVAAEGGCLLSFLRLCGLLRLRLAGPALGHEAKAERDES